MRARASVWVWVLVAFTMAPSAWAQVCFTEFTVHDNTRGSACLYACDLDGDHDMDILTAAIEDNDIAWFRNDGGDPISWTKFLIDGGMSAAHSVHANDIDGDGDLDVVGTSYGSAIVWYANDGGDTIHWTRHVITSSFTQAHEVYTTDVDGDGDVDVLGASSALNRITLWRSDGGNPPAWTPQIVDSFCGMAKSVHAADVDGDGRVDVLAAALADNDVKWYRNGGGEPIEWTSYIIDNSFGGVHRVQGVDLDADGDTDVLCAGYLNHQIAWYENHGGNPPTWTKHVIARNFMNACIAQAADVDGDGILDVVGTAQADDEVVWWHSSGEDTIRWTPFMVSDSLDRPWPLYVCDVDGDGDMDILAGSSFDGTNEIKLWRNDGGSSSAQFREVPVSRRIGIFPNPFNNAAAIRFSVSNTAHVRLSAYNLLGQQVQMIADRRVEAGVHQVMWDASQLPSGTYLVRVDGGAERVPVQKVVLVK